MFSNSQDVLVCFTFLCGITLAVELENVTSRPNPAPAPAGELELGSDTSFGKYFDWNSLSKDSSVVVTMVTSENNNFSSQEFKTLDRDVFAAGKIQISTRTINKNSVTLFDDGNSAENAPNKKEISKTINIVLLSDLSFSEASNLTKIVLENIVKLTLGPILVVFPKMPNFDLRLETLALNSNNGSRSRYELPLDLDMYLIFPSDTETRNESRFKLYELYSIKGTDYFLQVPVSNNQINFQTLSQKVVRRSRFNSAVIVAVADVTPIHELEASITWDEDGVIKFRDGTAVSVYWDLRDMLNFTEKALIGSYIGVAPGGVVFGKSYDLIESGEADLSISQITITDSRAGALQFLQPTANSNIVHAFFKQPALNTMRNFFAAPFSTTLWISIWSMWIVIIAVMMLMSWIKTKANRIQYDLHVQSKTLKVPGSVPATPATPATPEAAAPAKRKIREIITNNFRERKDLISELTTTMENDIKIDKAFLHDSYIWGIGAMCNQGWTVAPSWESLSMRIVFFCGSVTGLMIYVYYSATIVSVLSVKIAPIETFEDLLAYKYLLYVHEMSGTLKAFFLNSVKPHYNLSQPVVTASTAREVEMMLDSSSSFLSYPDVFYSGALNELNYTAGFLCTELDSVPAHLHPTSGAMFVRPGSPFRETFNYKILMLRERGFISRNNRNYNFKTVPKCDTSTNGKVHHLGMNTVYIAFCITFAGHGIAAVALAGEMFIKSRKI